MIIVAVLFSSCKNNETQNISDCETLQKTEIATQEPTDVTANVLLTNKRTAFTKTEVLKMYKQAADLVKLRCPGFTRTLANEIYEINTKGDGASLLNAALAVLTEDDRSSDSRIVIAKDDDLACRTYFPVYDTDYGCKLIDGASVASAVCYENSNAYELIIVFHEQNSDEGISTEFAQMMTPYSKETLLQNLNAYVPSLHAENCDAQLRYYNCEIRCNIDRKSGRMLSLSQKMVTAISLNVSLDLLLTEKTITAGGTMINHLDFTDFIWH